jgi:hypothetical protein
MIIAGEEHPQDPEPTAPSGGDNRDVRQRAVRTRPAT